MIHPGPAHRPIAVTERETAPFAGPCLNVWPDGDGCGQSHIRGRLDEHLCLIPVAYPHPCCCVRCGHPNGAAQ